MGSGDSWKNDFTPKYLEKTKVENEQCYEIELSKKIKTFLIVN